MTISVPNQLVYSYQGDGATTVFAYPVRFLDQDELVVASRDATGVDTVKILDTDYTVTGAGNVNGGSITTLYVPSGAETIVIYRDTEAKQIVDLKDKQTNPAEAVERQLDRLAMVAQDHDEALSRAVKLPAGNATDTDGLAESLLRLADSADNIDTVAGIESDVTTVAGVAASVPTVAVVADSIPAVAGVAEDIPTVAANISVVQTAADFINAAETDADRAEAARDIAAAYASDAVSQGNVPIYATVVGMSAISVPAGINALRVNGYSAAGDGGDALYKRVAAEPAHELKFQSLDGAWWEFAEKVVRPQHAGADATGATDATAAINVALDYVRTVGIYQPAILGRRFYLDGAGGLFRIDGSIDATGFTLGRNWGIRNMLIDAHCSGKVALDLTGSRFGYFSNIHIWGDQTDEPYTGLQVCVEDNGAGSYNPADNNYFENVSVDGYFLNAAIHNYGGEVCSWHCVRGWNRRVADVDGDSYALVLDGAGYKTPLSEFTTPYAGGRVSFTVNSFIHSQFLKPFGIAGPTIFMQEISNHNFVSCYMTNGSGAIIEWRLTDYEQNDVRFDVQVESNAGTGVDTFINFTSDAAAARTINGLEVRCWGTYIDTQFFTTDTLTALELNSFKLKVLRWISGSSPTNGIFGADRSLVTITNGDVVVPTFNDFSDATSFAAFEGHVADVSGNKFYYTTGGDFRVKNTGGLHTRLASKDDGTATGPRLELDRDSASPANSDNLGDLAFTGRNSVGAQTFYGFRRGVIANVTAESESGQINDWVRYNGTPTMVWQENGDHNKSFVPLQLPTYTVATLPSAATAAWIVYVSNGATNKRLAVSDGTNWRFPDGTIVS